MLPTTTHDLASQRAKIARAERRAKSDPSAASDVLQARAAYNAAKLEAYIRDAVASAPPLSAEQRDRLALLLQGGPDAA